MSKRKNNLTPKIFSVAIAIILWSYVIGSQNPEWPREYRKDVEFTNIEALERQGLIVMDPSEVRVSVGVTGRRSDMEGFTAADNIVAQLDLRGFGEGESRVPIVVTLKDSSPSVRITNVEPSHVLVTIDKIVTEEKTVNIRTSGEVSDNFTVGDLEADPQTISLKGPRTWLNQVSDVFVVVPITNEATTSKAYPVQVVDHNGDEVAGLEMSPSVVDITIPVYRKATLPIEAVFENELPDDYVMTDMEITPKSIAIRGGNQIADFTSIKTKPIDVNLFLENSDLEVELDLPENVELLDPNQRVTINSNIEQIDMREFEFDFSEINIMNQNEELILEENDGTIVFKVRGTETILDTVTKDTLGPYIDLENFTEGEFEVDININNIEGVTVESIEPERWTIILIREEESEGEGG